MTTVYQETGTIWENYSAEYQKPGSIAKRDFVGFSGLGPIALLIEEILGIEVDAPNQTIRWRLYPTLEHGLRNLRFGDNKVDLLAQTTNDGDIVIQVNAERPFTLHVEGMGVETSISVPSGDHRFTMDENV
jgi:hypothetical protein